MKKLISLTIFLFFSFIHFSLAETLSDWNDYRAYRPVPILFLHGFGLGNPQSWQDADVDTSLENFYSKYYSAYDSDPTILQSTRFPYLEIIDFGAELVDRNSSIDTYRAGDRYVETGQRNPGDFGWSDKVNSAVEKLRQSYRYKDNSPQKIILVSHSMGGLAARDYIENYSFANQKIEKLIMIGVPNLGSKWATQAVILHRTRRTGVHDFRSGWLSSSQIDELDRYLEAERLIDIDGDAVWDMDDEETGSGFIGELNDHYQNGIDYFVIAGISEWAFNAGDTIASLNNQLGQNVLSLKGQRIIDALHWDEPAVSISGENPLLKFLDPAPEISITYPNPDVTTEIYEPSTDIQGLVYKEYLPADSKLHIKIIKTDDNSLVLDEYRVDSVRPTLSWIPNNPDSPVAEFNQPVNFPSPGTYKISCSVKNPAGAESDIKDVFVKVTITNNAYIIVHCHNPEGTEINSVRGGGGAAIYDNDVLVGYGASNAATHNQPITISTGQHTIKTKFNGMTLEQNINLNPNETKILTFIFPRTNFDISNWLSSPYREILDHTWSGLSPVSIIYSLHSNYFRIGYYCKSLPPEGYVSGRAILDINFDGRTCYKYGKYEIITNFPPNGNAEMNIGFTYMTTPTGGYPIVFSGYPQIDSFDYWYVQSESSFSSKFNIKFNTGDISMSFGNTILLPSNRSKGIFQSLNVRSRDFGAGISGWIWHNASYETSDVEEYYDNTKILYCASVPYDLTGTGIK